jgi:HAD superfamily hydrolase (TIGR01509 family)
VTASATSPLRAVLFDMDGLLLDSEPLWFEAESAVMARLGVPWTAGDQEELLGGSLERTVGYMLGKARAAPGAAGARASSAQVGRWLLTGMTELLAARGVPLRPGARELLAEVAAAGVPHALVTSSHREIMRAALEATKLEFAVTVCREDVTRGKPGPEPYLRAAGLLGVPAAGCVVLEDSPNGIAAGLAAGCAVIAVPSLPLPVQPGVPTVASLAELSLSRLREVAACQGVS